ncbi:MAG: hypothetical protein ACRC20_00295 [Segniliparus sp.]|uniref:hypothetical protein n=1 Tax=Segniliparus sp. TaxID=2804064 RepID=UPI003F40BD73
MSNIAVNTFAMKAAVIGTGSLEEIQQLGMAGQAYRPWATKSWTAPAKPGRAGLPMIDEIHERVVDGRSGRAANHRRPSVWSSAARARV